MVSYPAGGLLFVVVMAFDVNDKHRDFLVIDIVNDSIVCRDASRIGDVVATSEGLWMAADDQLTRDISFDTS